MKKVILIVYAIAASVTFAVALLFVRFLDMSIYSALPLAAAIYMGIGASCMYSFGEFNRHTLSRRLFGFDFKYSKKSGESEFNVITERRGKGAYSVYVLIYAIISAMSIPFVFFFPYFVKVGFSLVVLIASPLIQLGIEGRRISQRIKGAIDQSKLEREELDEQKKREEMGKWK